MSTLASWGSCEASRTRAPFRASDSNTTTHDARTWEGTREVRNGQSGPTRGAKRCSSLHSIVRARPASPNLLVKPLNQAPRVGLPRARRLEPPRRLQATAGRRRGRRRTSQRPAGAKEAARRQPGCRRRRRASQPTPRRSPADATPDAKGQKSGPAREREKAGQTKRSEQRKQN
jgi:hypothetical protein